MNAAAHRLGAALTVGGFSAYNEYQKNRELSAKPLVDAGLAALCGTLPDLLEPAHHPNHRQFFHSLTFASVTAYGLYRAYQWEAESDWEKLLRTLAIVGSSAYLIHLAMDATTAKSLPLI